MPSKKQTKKSVPKQAKRATRKTNNSGNNAAPKRAAMSVSHLQESFKKMHSDMNAFIKKNNLNNPSALGKQVSRLWEKNFGGKPISDKAAASLVNHYRGIHGKNKKSQKGGYLVGAPINYEVRAGLPGVATYGVFPTEVGADIKASSHLDVYYNSALGRGCGTENTTAQVPKDMGSNLVPAATPVPAKGGARRRRHTRRSVGGDFIAAMNVRHYVAENPAGTFQQLGEKWYGQPVDFHDKPDPTDNNLSLQSDGKMPIDPRGISVIDKDITLMANPSPYPSVK